MKILLKDGSSLEVAEGASAFDATRQISEGLARAALACEIDGEAKDLSSPLHEGCMLNILTFDSPKGKEVFWHTTSHILAHAVKRLYPQALLTIGPAIDAGFYYDIDCDVVFTPEILEAIQAEMKKIIKENPQNKRYVISKTDSL